jgi:hypothetical protein
MNVNWCKSTSLNLLESQKPSHLFSYIEPLQIVGGDDNMKIERTFVGKDSFLTLFMPLIEAEIDRIIERQEYIKYNEGNANTSHSERVA